MSTYRLRQAAILFLSLLVSSVYFSSSAVAGRGAKNRLNPSSARNEARNLSSIERRASVPLRLQKGSTLGKSKSKIEKLLNKAAPQVSKTVAKKSPERSSVASSATKTKAERPGHIASAKSPVKKVAKKIEAALRSGPVAKTLKSVSKMFAVAGTKFVRHRAIRSLITRYSSFRASITRVFSRAQSRAPPALARAIGQVRQYSLGSLLAYMHHKLKSDKFFLGWYFASNALVVDVGLPTMVTLGLSTTAATVLYALATPISVGVLVAREHTLRKRAGKHGTIQETAISVLSDYQQFSGQRFAEAIKNANAPIYSRQ